ncbi:MAG: DUF5667 domain-containing protein [Candidatus Levyibacteriota bacterium]
MRKYLAIFLVLFIFSVSTSSAVAYRKQVLGIEDQNLSIPATTEGPGIFLPDSPFFFLDQLKQNVRVALAFTPEAKAKVYTSIAGERLAELRFMLDKKDLAGIRTDLEAISSSYKLAADQVSFAKMSGKDVSVLAKEINDQIKAKQKVLDELHIKAEGEVESDVRSAADGLTIAKSKVENSLNETDLKNEIKDDLLRETEMRLHDATESAMDLKEILEDLEEEANSAAKESLKEREKALRNAIEEKNEELKKAEQRRLALEKQQRNKILEMQNQAIESAQEIVENAQETAKKFEEIKYNSENTKDLSGGTKESLSSENSSIEIENESVDNSSE